MPDTASAAEQSVADIVELERLAAERSSRSERVSEAILSVVGSLACLAVHLAGFAAWVTLNLGAVPGITPFDPFPFGILTLIVSAEGVFLCLLILISQNRSGREANHRAHLNLQISALAERESTKLLQILHSVARRLGAESADAEARHLSEPTDVRALAGRLEEELKR